MKFSAVALFVAGALAATPVLKHPAPVERDVATITSALSNIEARTQALGDAIRNFDGNVLALAGASGDAQNAITEAQAAIEPTEPLTLQEAIGIQGATESLTNTVSSTIDAIIAQKGALVSAGVGSIVQQQLNSQRDASNQLSETIISKVPSDVQDLARQLSAGIAENIQRGIDAYADISGGGGGASSAPAPTSADATSAAASATEAVSSAASAASSAVSSAAGAISSAASAATTTRAATPSGASSTPGPSSFTGAAALPTAAVGYVLAAAGLIAAL